MALQPKNFVNKERLQPGARGEVFQANLPGYREGEDRVNRTMTRLNMNDHDVPNIKYMLDDRLPVLFRYGYAFGYNQIVLPKGRIVAVDPVHTLVDFDMQKEHNVLTIANGGVPVKVRTADALTEYAAMKTTMGQANIVSAEVAELPGVGKEWMPEAGFAATYAENKYYPTKKHMLDTECVEAAKKAGVRAANIPVGIIERNEYTRDDDAFNGMMPGPIRTDAMVELPYFLHKDKAEQNPWGSAYGALVPGMLVKSDENGRVVASPLSIPSLMASMSVAEYEAERQQVIGQVMEVKEDLIPEGAAVYAQWALADILNFEAFNPDEYRKTNRRGEDNMNASAHNSTGKYPGYPYEKAYKDHDLHMLESYRGTYDQRMQHQHRYDFGIPGLTDGYNAVANTVEDKNLGVLAYAGDDKEYTDVYIRTINTDIHGPLTIKATIGATTVETELKDEKTAVGTTIKLPNGDDSGLVVKFVSFLQGLVVLAVADKAKLKLALEHSSNVDAEGAMQVVEFGAKYIKRGQAGVPTFMDWDGCKGSVKVLLQK